MHRRRITICAPAKVNLHLSIGGVRPDGYHDLETVFHTLDLADTLVFEVRERAESQAPVVIEGAGDSIVGAASTAIGEAAVAIPLEDNLIYRAYRAFEAHTGVSPLEEGEQLHVLLDKRIPMRAGLGGGSSDAAATLLACATMAGVDSRSRACLEAAASLGADVAFFLFGGCVRMAGRGEVLRSRFVPLSMPILLTNHGPGVSTAAAYRAFDADPQPFRSADRMASLLDGEGVVRPELLSPLLHNNMTAAACALSPEVSEQLTWLDVQPETAVALVSGSGSACFATLKDGNAVSALALRAREAGFWACPVHLSASGVALVSDETR